MKITTVNKNSNLIADVFDENVIISDAQSALDLIMSIKYETGAQSIIINKEAICEEFFILSSGIAGEILQKFINYHARLAIYADFSKYTSKPLKDFIYESNKGKNIFFVTTKDEALEKLTV